MLPDARPADHQALASLALVLRKSGQVGIVRAVTRVRSPVCLYALFPAPPHTDSFMPPGLVRAAFYMKKLPYAEDVRHHVFPKLADMV